MSVAQAFYTYIQASNLYNRLENDDSLRQHEISSLISEYDYQKRLEYQFNSVLEGTNNQKDSEKTKLLSKISDLEDNLSRLSSDLEGAKKNVQSNNSHNIVEKKTLEKQISDLKKTLEKQISDLKSQLEREKSTSQRIENDKSTLQSAEKSLKLEITDLKSQINRQKAATDKETREKEKLKSQFANQKSVLELKLDTLKGKLDKANSATTRPLPVGSSISNVSLRPSPNKSILPTQLSPTAPPSFSPLKPRHSVYATTASSLAKAAMSASTHNKSNTKQPTTATADDPFKIPTPSIPSPLKHLTETTSVTSPAPTTTAPVSRRKSRPSFQGDTSFTATTKEGNKTVSLFDSDDEDMAAVQPQEAAKTKRKRKLKATVKSFDEDDPDNPGSQFKRVSPNVSIFNKEISPVKSRNDGIRKTYRV